VLIWRMRPSGTDRPSVFLENRIRQLIHWPLTPLFPGQAYDGRMLSTSKIKDKETGCRRKFVQHMPWPLLSFNWVIIIGTIAAPQSLSTRQLRLFPIITLPNYKDSSCLPCRLEGDSANRKRGTGKTGGSRNHSFKRLSECGYAVI